MEGGKYDIPEIPDIPGLDDDDVNPGGGGGGVGAGRSGGGGGSRSGGSGRTGPRRWLWLLVGTAVGVAGTLFLPSLVAPYLPTALRPDHQEVRGLVLEKSREADRLLLTVESERGAMLATFAEQVAELDLLVTQGDSVTLSLGAYRPFVDDPSVTGVRKNAGGTTGTDAQTDVAGDPPESGEVDPDLGTPEAQSDSAAAESDTSSGVSDSSAARPDRAS